MVVAVELLSFAMPVPTIVSRAERLASTPAHDEVTNLLAPGERLAGEGRTFFPSTTQLFDIPDARGQLLKSAGYQELLRFTRARRGDDNESEIELGGAANVERAMRRATNQEVTRLEKTLTFLATTASTAPFIGLFGTVWGIMNAFRGLSTAHTSIPPAML